MLAHVYEKRKKNTHQFDAVVDRSSPVAAAADAITPSRADGRSARSSSTSVARRSRVGKSPVGGDADVAAPWQARPGKRVGAFEPT
jgi:hypothetical protein